MTNDFLPIREVYYFQELFDKDEDYRQHYRLLLDARNPPSDWTRAPVNHATHFLQAYRVSHGFFQRLVLEVTAPPADFILTPDDWSVNLFSQLERLNPIYWRVNDCVEMRLLVGRSRTFNRFYVRYPGLTSLAPSELMDECNGLGFGFEEPADRDLNAAPHWGLFWWVSYFDRIEQAEFQAAYDRLTAINEWLYEIGKRAHGSARREVRRKLKRISEHGWEFPEPLDTDRHQPGAPGSVPLA